MATVEEELEREVSSLEDLLKGERDLNTRLKREVTERDARIVELEAQLGALVGSGSDLDFAAYCAKFDFARDRFMRTALRGTYDQRDRMIQMQAEHITKLRDKAREAFREVDEARATARSAKRSAHYYDMIQKACLEDETVMAEWQRFCAVLQMVEADDTPAVSAVINA